ncbi:Multicopper oxidase with three cupredoxin domains (includes cell division protein FtsP and spore coat protein CotA) [Streptomyces sp. cf386]|uniref:multicopper oxidase family protein n=1 Tax=Streptomyces sp. cf386 TaxID=1761904 RepID=UPI00088ABBEB|nr:multicopper oxidase family protein [Streptomyces sp. cf386]SDN49678.1 Multicopper oxidase with three cupredoxin domains (includes cell division protein FtsP and spore coat protein CotA) [Streptomyces sp. cf386]
MNDISRRSLLLAALGAAGASTLAACTNGSGSTPALVSPSGSAVAAAEKRRAGTGTVRNMSLTAAPAVLDLGGGVTAKSWAFSGQVPGKEIRVSVGDTLAAELSNQLPNKTTTSLHWHGIALRNDMDGAPPVTQRAVRAGSNFTYRFITGTPGTYFVHPHVGVQLDRGLYAPLIVEDPNEPLSYDDEWVVVLDDWIDGVTGTPDEVYDELRQGMAGGMHMGGFMLMGATSDLLGGDAGDVKYPYHLVNGRVAADPVVHRGRPGKRVRLRIINAGGDTAYRVALGDHRMTVTHTDGYPVEHQEVDALLIGMGERYDVLVTLGDGVFPLVALAEGKGAAGRALVRTGAGTAPRPGVRPQELDGKILTAAQLRATDDIRLTSKTPDRVHRVELTGDMHHYNWAINGEQLDMSDPAAHPLIVEAGERVRLDFVNRSTMWHPIHLHGHTYQLGTDGPRKDTAIVLPKKTVSVVFDADNPGQWMLHCHNAYHAEAGMMAVLAYRA